MPEPLPDSRIYAETAGLILAGGLGARLANARKADLLLGGHRLLDLACNNLDTQVHHICIAIGGHSIAPSPSENLRTFVADPGLGPAAAILVTADQIELHAPTAAFLAVAPCDAPFMPSNFVQSAMPKFDRSTAAVIGGYGGRTFPTHAVWRLSALKELKTRFLPTDNPSIFRLLDLVEHKILALDAACSTNPFFNINTPADLVAANRRFAEISAPSFS